MKRFMAVFLGTPNSEAGTEWEALDAVAKAERERAGMTAWQNWAKVHAKSIIDHGSPLGKTKLVNRSGVANGKNALCAYTIVQAESHEAAAKMFVNHPHFTIFPGDSVEIVECLPMPEM